MPRPRSTASVRKQLAEAVSAGYDQAYFAELIKAAKGAETSAAAECPECGATMRVKTPDVKKQLDAVLAFLEESEGKVGQALPDATTVIIERPARD